MDRLINTEATTREFYSPNGWKGSNYRGYMPLKDLTKILRDGIKAMYPECKWSICMKSGSNSISVALLEAPYNVFTDPIAEVDGYMQLNHYCIDREACLHDIAIEMMTKVIAFINSYRYDDSNPMIDYFDTNFYYDISVGKWDRRFRVVKPDAPRGEYTCKIEQDVDTRDNSPIWIVKPVGHLNKDDYASMAKEMRAIGGHYSRYKHGFLFRTNPADIK